MVDEIDYIYHIDLEYNREKLLQEALQLNFNAFPSLSAISKTKNIPTTSWFDKPPTWLSGFFNEDKRVNFDQFPETATLHSYIENKIGCSTTIRVYKQQENTELPMHRDLLDTRASINVVLSERSAPITMEDIGDTYYDAALINIRLLHGVKKHPDLRVVLKFSISDKEYQDVLECFVR